MNSVFILWTRAVNEPSQSFTVPKKAPTRRTFSLLIVPTSACTIKNLLRHYAKQAFDTVNSKLRECSLPALLWTTAQDRDTHRHHTGSTQAAGLRCCCCLANVELDENRSGSC